MRFVVSWSFRRAPHRFAEPPHIPDDAVDLLLQMDDALQMVDQDEFNKFVEQREKAKEHKRQRAEFAEASVKKKKVVVGAGAPCINTLASKKPQTQASKAGQRVYPPTFPVGDVTQKLLSALAPPGAHVWQDRQHGGWQGHYKPFPRVGRSWASHGGCRAAGIWVLQDLWTKWSIHNAVPIEACPIQYLFQLTEGSDAAASALASNPAASSGGGA